MDMTASIAPKSDQMDADDLLGGAQTFTITEVKLGPSNEQPFNFILAEFPRPWRPCKTVRKLIVAAWGPETTVYHGRRLTLVRDPSVTWAGEEVGGIRVTHMSDMVDGKPMRVSVQATSKTKTSVVIQPLPDAPPPPDYVAQVAAATDKPALNVIWKAAGDAGHLTDKLRNQIKARGAELDQQAAAVAEVERLQAIVGEQA